MIKNIKYQLLLIIKIKYIYTY